MTADIFKVIVSFFRSFSLAFATWAWFLVSLPFNWLILDSDAKFNDFTPKLKKFDVLYVETGENSRGNKKE